MTLTVGVATKRCFDHCLATLQSITRTDAYNHVDRIIIHDGSLGGAHHTLLPFLQDTPIYTEYVIPEDDNGGWPAAQNYFLKNGGTDPWDLVIICNDDVIFGEHTIHRLVEASNEYREAFMLHPEFPGVVPWSLYMMRPKTALETVGLFDENFAPVYFDDNDYWYRMRLAGHSPQYVFNAEYTHVGSASINHSQEVLNAHHPRFRRNDWLYAQKWGGVTGRETYIAPYNNADEATVQRILHEANTRSF